MLDIPAASMGIWCGIRLQNAAPEALRNPLVKSNYEIGDFTCLFAPHMEVVVTIGLYEPI